jgi:hydrogenase nickel incorporation protein HypA/HybF
MHETVLAQRLHKLILAESAKYGKKPVAAKISCGVFAAVNDDLLREALDAISKATAIENLKLKIEHKPPQGLCEKCKQKFNIDLSNIKCSFCGSDDFQLLPDAPLILEEIEFESEKKNENKGRKKHIKRK